MPSYGRSLVVAEAAGDDGQQAARLVTTATHTMPITITNCPLTLQRRLRGGAGRGSKRPASGQRSVRGDGPPQQRNRPAAPEAAPPAADPSDEEARAS